MLKTYQYSYGKVKHFFKDYRNYNNLSIDELTNLILWSPLSLRYISEKNQSDDLCWLAIKNDLSAIKYVRNKTQQMCDYVIKRDKNLEYLLK